MKTSKLLTKEQRQQEWGYYVSFKRKGLIPEDTSFEDWLTKIIPLGNGR
jgi:hypothetical protein